MLKWMILFSLRVYTECSISHVESTVSLDDVINRHFQRYLGPKKINHDSNEKYNKLLKKGSNINDIKRRESLNSCCKDHLSRTYHKQKKIPEVMDKTANSVEISSKNKKNYKEIRLQMPNIQPNETDIYMCYGYILPAEDSYLVKFTPIADQKVAHHMLLFGCEESHIKDKSWVCGEMQLLCKTGMQRILYAWAKNAPPLEMPKDVGIHVGGQSGINYLVIQVHYLDVSSFKDGHVDASGAKISLSFLKPNFFAGIYFIADEHHSIPEHKKKVHIDMGCSYKSDNNLKRLPIIHPFRFRTHTHKLGTVVTGYRIRDGKWVLIGKGDPQKPQAFYKVFNKVQIKDGDKIYARCTFNSTNKSNTTYIGTTHNDEMCNYYIMYFYDANAYHPPILPCGYVDADKDSLRFPVDSDTPLIQTEN